MDTKPLFDLHQTGGQASIIIKAPSECVWLVIKDFFDLSWWDSKYNIVKLNDVDRLLNVSSPQFRNLASTR
jgi:hypothetical protein